MLNFWNGLPYKTTGSIIRAIRAGLAAAVGILVAANAAGTLVPPEAGPYVAVIITSLLLGADKYLRESRAESDETKDAEDVDDGTPEPPAEDDDTTEEDSVPEPEPDIEEDVPIVEEPLEDVDIPPDDADSETGLTGD